MPPPERPAARLLTARERRLAGALVVAGAAAFAWGAALGDALRAWQALLVNFLFFTGLAQAGVVLSALLQLTSARWGRPLKRAAEATAAFLPVSALLLALLLAGLPAWAPWAAEASGHDDRGGWLTLSRFAARESAALLLLAGVTLAYLYHSLRPDVGLLREAGAPAGGPAGGPAAGLAAPGLPAAAAGRKALDGRAVAGRPAAPSPAPAAASGLTGRTAGQTAGGTARLAVRLTAGWRGAEEERERGQRRQTLLAPVVLLAWGWVFSLLAFDFVVALDAHWYSSLAGGYFFTGSLLGGIALLALVAARGRARLGLAAHVGPPQLHDLGALLFGVAVVWAYLLWSQYLVIWYGDLPEEAAFVGRRLQAPWAPLTWLAAGLVFLLPFAALLGRRLKASPRGLAAVAAAVLAGLWLERFVLVAPSLWPHADSLPLGLPELLVTGGAGGAFVLCYARFLEAVPVLPVSDPLLEEAAHGRL